MQAIRQGLRALAVAAAIAITVITTGGVPQHQAERSGPAQTSAIGTIPTEPRPDAPLEGGGGGGNGLRA